MFPELVMSSEVPIAHSNFNSFQIFLNQIAFDLAEYNEGRHLFPGISPHQIVHPPPPIKLRVSSHRFLNE